ncbi:hypothetical protein TcWFU_003946 [Taenia crassiceps]|uniref:Laminin EGF-like domain-containing protein n=1 Tax=Taenia crassiceps TaxID=6207 RepID=A0ABR4PZA7_9CEST
MCVLENTRITKEVIRGVYSALPLLVAAGIIRRYQLEEMNRPLFLARMRQGEFDPPESNPYASLNKDDFIQSPKHRQLSLRLLRWIFEHIGCNFVFSGEINSVVRVPWSRGGPGSCAHAPGEIRNLEKVYGVCECTHNTAGDNCEKCASFYQNKPWRPASRHSANACERCECHDHSDQCYFNPILYLQSGNVSGGAIRTRRGDRWVVTVDVKQEGSPCRNVPTRVEITSDTRKVVVPTVCMTGDRKTFVAIMPEAREGSPYTGIEIGNIIFKLDDGEAGSVAEYCESYRELSEQILSGEVDPSQMPQRCQTYFSIPESHWKEMSALAIPCECNVTGSYFRLHGL